jgi:hypothetical protein
MERRVLEERLRLRLKDEATRITADVDAWDRFQRRLHWKRWRQMTLAIAGVVIFAAALRAGVSIIQRNDGGLPSAGTPSTLGPHRPAPKPPELRGLAPPRRHVGGRIEYKLTTTSGKSFWISLPSSLPGQTDPIVVPEAPVIVKDDPQTPRQWLTIVAPRQVAEAGCAQFTASIGAPCSPRLLVTKTLPSGARLIHWDLGTDETTTTVQLGSWTLVLEGPKPDLAEAIADGLGWSIDGDGFVRLHSTSSRVQLGAGGAWLNLGAAAQVDELLQIVIHPGCTLGPQAAGTGRSELERPDDHQGSWCLGRAYQVHVATPKTASRELVYLLYEGLRVLPA